MTDFIFPTGSIGGGLSGATRTTSLLASNGTATGPVSVASLLGQIVSSDLANASVLTSNIAYNSPISVTPTGNGGLATTAALNIQGTTSQSNKREWLLTVGLTNNTGYNANGFTTTSNGTKVTDNLGDKVGIYSGIVASGSTAGATWALNTVTIINSDYGTSDISGAKTCVGYELDVNNSNRDVSNDFANSVYGMTMSGASSFNNTAGILLSGIFATQWQRGIMGSTGISDVFIEDRSSSNVVFRALGTHALGLDFTTTNFTSGAIAMNRGARVFWTDGSTAVQDYADSSGNRFVGSGAAGTFIGGSSVVPISDNAQGLGGQNLRWAIIWSANGTIQTSDENLKTNIQKVPSTLDLVKEINPIKFQWKSGGRVPVETHEKQMVDVKESHARQVPHQELGDDGKWYAKTSTEYHDTQVFDHVPVHDEHGNPVIDYHTSKHDGSVMSVPRTHKVPKKMEKLVKVTKYADKPGKRVHWGFAAQEVKEAMDKHGMGDFGGHVIGEDGTHGLRPDQLIPILWKATQEMLEKINHLEDKLKLGGM